MPRATPRKGRPFRRSRHVWLSSRIWRRRLVFWLGAVLVGYVAVGFAIAANYAQDAFQHLVGRAAWAPLIVSPAVMALSAWIALCYFPGSQGSGIPQAIAARDRDRPDLRNRLLGLRTAAGKIVLCLLGLLGGASIGREGPTVQIGAAIMVWAARSSGIGREPGLILAGSAAGVAAAFNTPLAGIMFAIEEMGRSFHQRINSLVLIAVVLAGIAALSVMGFQTYFGRSEATLEGFQGWVVVAVTGVVGGLCGGLFTRLMLGITGLLPTLWSGLPKRHPVQFAALCGLVVAVVGVACGGITYGTGYEQAASVITEGQHLPWYFMPAKLVATLASSVSGIPGGLFAPSLSVGAGLGSILSGWFPAASVGAVAVLATAAYFTGVVQAPLTAFVIVMEMTGNQAMLIPLMATSVIAYGVSRLVCREPLYHALAKRFLAAQSSPVPPKA